MRRDFPKNRQKNPSFSKGNPSSSWRERAAAHSPYLMACLARFPMPDALSADMFFSQLLSRAKSSAEKAGDAQTLMKSLRQAKLAIAACAGAADLKKEWDEPKVMLALSDFADLAVTQSLGFLLKDAQKRKILRAAGGNKNPARSGICVIAVGKWGARELNYSSDIDLMVIYDPEHCPVREKDETQSFCNRLTRDLARLLDQPTGDGYVFRTDLRLRPDPGAMPLAISIGTAETYYSSLGQNWERAAMIKARPVAGDMTLGEDFMKLMRAWIWRKSLDFAAIQDIHSIKRQINARQKTARGENPFLGYNVKLGHGGIREIEFFAQTQQLIFGGRDPRLRAPQTLQALRALAETGHISMRQEKDLSAAYLFLRRTEHRLQMQEDRQTHSLPSQATDFRKFTQFMEYPSDKAFAGDLKKHTDTVKKTYANLFTESRSLSGAGNLVFTGVEDDPETLVTLRKLGFTEPEKITAAIRGWHHGRYRAMRSEKARQLLTEITPALLEKLGKTPHPDDAFLRFDGFLARLPAGVPVFSMFAHHPAQMDIVADIMGTSPALADFLATHPAVLDGVLSQDFMGRLPESKTLETELRRLLSSGRDYQDILDLMRRWVREKKFHAGLHILKSLSPPEDCGLFLTRIAETAVRVIASHVEKEFSRQHGVFKTGELVILSMGSLAAGEMFADSDLDIVGIYKVPDREIRSTGPKPLPPAHYYARLMQRLISAISAPTAEGVMYEIDTRLRPAGADGPLAVKMEGYFDYLDKSAWTWEHMSLLRSRLIRATPTTRALFEKNVLKIIARPRDAAVLRRDVLEMRKKIERQFGADDPWNLKYRPGGLVDILFLIQYLMLKNGLAHRSLPPRSLAEGLAWLGKNKILQKRDAAALEKAARKLLAIQGFLRLSAELPFDATKASPALKNALMAHASDARKPSSFASFRKDIDRSCAAVRSVYKKTLEC